MRKQLVILWTS